MPAAHSCTFWPLLYCCWFSYSSSLLFSLSFSTRWQQGVQRASFPREPFSNPKGSDQMTSLSFYGVPIYLARRVFSLSAGTGSAVFLYFFSCLRTLRCHRPFEPLSTGALWVRDEDSAHRPRHAEHRRARTQTLARRPSVGLKSQINLEYSGGAAHWKTRMNCPAAAATEVWQAAPGGPFSRKFHRALTYGFLYTSNFSSEIDDVIWTWPIRPPTYEKTIIFCGGEREWERERIKTQTHKTCSVSYVLLQA
jgi:hypothetical protein